MKNGLNLVQKKKKKLNFGTHKIINYQNNI